MSVSSKVLQNMLNVLRDKPEIHVLNMSKQPRYLIC